MKRSTILVSAALALFLSAGLVQAGGMPGHGDGKSHYGEMMKERQQMMTDMMDMMKETMAILRNLNHKPSAEERERLGEMMQHLDEMKARHEAMHEMMRQRMKEMHDKKEKGSHHM